jgi:hypothetical protein
MDKKLAGLLGAAAAPHNDVYCPGHAGARTGTPASYQLSRPSRPDPKRAATSKSRRSTSGPERQHPDRPGCGRTSSSSSPSRRWRLRPRRAARPSPPPPPSSPSPPSPSRVLMRRKGHSFGCPLRMHRHPYERRSCKIVRCRARRGGQHVDADHRPIILRKNGARDCGAAKSDFSPKRPWRPKQSPSPNHTTMNPGEMFHKLQSRRRLRSTWPKLF